MTDERKALHHLYDEAARIERMPRGTDRDIEIRTFLWYFKGYVRRILEPIPVEPGSNAADLFSRGRQILASEPESDMERDRR